MRFAFPALIAFVGVLALGCEPGEPTPTPRFTDSDAEAIAKQVIPGFADLPTGFELVDTIHIISNRQVRERNLESRDTRRAIDDYRRLTGAYASYRRGGTEIFVSSEVFHSSKDALAYFNSFPDGYASQEDYVAKNYAYNIAEDVGLAVDEVAVTVTRLSSPQVGQSTWVGRVAVAIDGQVGLIWMGCMAESTILSCVQMRDSMVSVGSEDEVAVLDTIRDMLVRVADKAKALTG